MFSILFRFSVFFLLNSVSALSFQPRFRVCPELTNLRVCNVDAIKLLHFVSSFFSFS